VARLLFHNRYLDYDFGPEHPFSPTRQEMVVSLLEALGDPLDPLHPPVATREDVLRIHGEPFVEKVEAASDGTAPPHAVEYGLDTGDVPVFGGMDLATRGLVGGTLEGARLLVEDGAKRILQLGGGLHHARRDEAAGFCVYNDLSVAIDWLRDRGLRVAYVDIDVHHGDGVQWLHYDDPGVLTVSLHESGRHLYPGTGGVAEIGEAAGRGTAVNVPLAPNTESESYLHVFDQVVPTVLERFGPDVLVVQCGADAHFSDPLADLLLTTQTYDALFDRLLNLADEYTDDRLLCTLGGGYRLDAVARVWTMLALRIQDLKLPTEVPSEWREQWQSRAGEPLTKTLHDPERTFDVSGRTAVVEQNERTGAQVLGHLAPHWR